MRAALLAAALVLVAACGSSSAAAVASPSPPSTGSPAPASFGLECRLPITWYPSDAVAGVANSFVGMFNAATGAISATAPRPPLHLLSGGPSYDAVIGRWLPVPANAVAPDGLHYAYAEWDPPASGMAGGAHSANTPTIGVRGRIHLVDARTGADSIVYSGEPTYSVARFGDDSILLAKFNASMAGASHSGLYLLRLSGAAPPVLVEHSDYPLDGAGWSAIDGDTAAWGTAWSNGVSGLGVGNVLLRLDMKTHAVQTWLTVAEDHAILLLGVVDHAPVVETVRNATTAGEPVDARILMLSAPDQSKLLTAINGFNDPIPGNLVQDSNRVWFSGLGTLWLYDRSVLRYVRTLPADEVVEVGGPCLT